MSKGNVIINNALEDELRKLIFTKLNIVKKLLLTQNDLKTITFVSEKKQVTPSEVAKFKNININNASTKLKKLFDQGYLIRLTGRSPSGGVEFIYSVAGVIRPTLNKPCPICKNEECIQNEDWCYSCCNNFYEKVQG